VREDGKSVKDELMPIVVDGGGGINPKVSSWRDGHSVVEQFANVVGIGIAWWNHLFTGINSMSNPSFTGFPTASAQGAIVALISFVEPKILVKSVWMAEFSRNLLLSKCPSACRFTLIFRPGRVRSRRL